VLVLSEAVLACPAVVKFTKAGHRNRSFENEDENEDEQEIYRQEIYRALICLEEVGTDRGHPARNRGHAPSFTVPSHPA